MGTQREGATALYSDPDFAFPRYLAANNGDPIKAGTMQMEGAAWRQLFRPDLLRIEDALEAIGRFEVCAPGTVSRKGEALIFCERFRAHTPMAETPYQTNRALLLGNAYVLENALSRRTTRVVVIVCCDGMTRAMVDDLFIRIATEFLILGFPGAVSEFVCHSLPAWVSLAFHALAPFVSRELCRILRVSSGDPKSTLTRIADPSQLPIRYGGNLPDEGFSPTAYISQRRAIETAQGRRDARVDVGFPPWIWVEPLPSEASKLPDTMISGKLRKLGAIVRLWKPFFVVVLPGKLFYFKHETDSKAYGGFDLRRVIARRAQAGIDNDFSSSNRIRGIVFVTPLRSFQFLCKNEQDRERWLAVVSRAIPSD